jgi:hypothetical protein
MGIRFLCPACQKRINVKEHQAGKRGFCPKCGAPVQIPLTSQIPANPHRDDDSSNRLASAAQGSQPQNVPPQTAAIPGGQHAPSAASPQAVTSQQAGGVPVGRIVAVAGPIVDPLVEVPGAVWYVSSEGHSQPFGPADSATMGQWLHEGRVGPASLVWRQDWPEWRKAATVWPQLAGPTVQSSPHMQAPPMPPAPSPPLSPTTGMSTAPHVSGASKPPAPVSSAAPSPGIYYQRRASNSYAITVVVLVLLVLVLAAVMYWVLTRDLGSAAPEKAALAEPGMNDFGTEYFQRNRI